MRRQFILATNNSQKIIEMKEILKDLHFEILTLSAFPEIPKVNEDGDTLEANAEKKALSIYQATGIVSLADDTGLEVEYLDRQPGVHSSRFAGEEATYEMNNDKLLRLLKGVPREKRKATFRCVMAIAEEGRMTLLEGRCEGYITEEKRGHHGFGYDPLFYVPHYEMTFAEMPLSLKNKISHRARSLMQVYKYFESR